MTPPTPVHPIGASPPVPTGPRPLLTFEDLTADLLWPRLLRCALLALAPGRLGLGLVLVAVLMSLVHLARVLPGAAAPGAVTGAGAALAAGVRAVGEGVIALDPWRAGTALAELAVGAPARVAAWPPLGAVLLLPVAGLAWVVLGAAIARMAACELALGATLSWPEGLGFALGRVRSLLFAQFAPLLTVWVLALGLAAAGWALLQLPVLDVLGAVLYGLALAVGLLATVITLVYLGGQVLLVPAVACDGADAINAIERAYAYTLGRPVRLALYLAIAGAVGVASTGLVALVVAATLHLTGVAAGAWIALPGTVIPSPFEAAGTPPPPGSSTAARWIIGLWQALALAVVPAFAASFYFSASTMVYLLMRRLNDGQDTGELWLPGMVEGTMSPLEPPASGAPPASVPTDGGRVAELG